MKKLLFVILVSTIFFITCDNGDMENEKETNPYPDGVYPFEVSNVSHEGKNTNDGYTFTVTWDIPSNMVSNILIDFYLISTNPNVPGDKLHYSSYNNPDYDGTHLMFIPDSLNKTSFIYRTGIGNNTFIIIKCADKYGNTSNGIRHDIPSPFPNLLNS